MSATVVASDGRFSAVRGPHSASLASRRRKMPSMVRAGDAMATGVASGTGQAAGRPASGSRIMPLKNPEAAPLGLPGRTLTVMSRTLRPRTKPLRVKSATSCSPMNFWMP
jgi:hypothetical protein